MDFLTMSIEDRAKHFAGLTSEALTEVHATLTAALAPVMTASATNQPTVAEVAEAAKTFAIRDEVEAEQKTREDAALKAAADLAEMQKRFSINDGVESGPESEEGEESEEDAESDEDEETEESDEDAEVDSEVEAADGDNPFDKKKKEEEDDAMTAAAARGATRLPARKQSAASKVAAKAKRPPAKSSGAPVTITAAADVEGFAAGQSLTMEQVTEAAINRVKGFPKFNLNAAKHVREEAGDQPVLRKFGTARFSGMHSASTLTASSGPGQEHNAVKTAVADHVTNLKAGISDKYMGDQEALTAAGFCAPSTISYDYLADYSVWGIAKYPEVPAPRGGLMTTTGPALAQTFNPQGTDFGWVLTEAQMEAGDLKTCETIVCPDFEDHRLDAIGYCWKIPILTEKGYPELVTDAMRLSTVLWQHKLNALNINDALALSTAVVASGLGGSFDDTLEALSIIAVKERRKWNLGDTAIMEVKMPTFVKAVFMAELRRRPFMAFGSVSEAQIVAEFSKYYLAPDFVTDWAELTGANPVFPATFPAQIYPAGTFVTSVEDVISLSAVYDAASLVKNEYTGVFYEQARMLYKAGYGATKFTIPICTAGLVGAPILDCHPESANWAGQKQAIVA